MKKSLFLLVLIFLTPPSFACSSIWFIHNGYFLLGANLDGEGIWNGLIFVNQRNVSKSTDFYNDGDSDIKWISKYGSVTFNLVCKEYAQYGMNEAGLIVSTVSNPKTVGPLKDKRPAMLGNFWVQYILDNCKTVDEVKSSLNEIRIMPGSDRYVICDRNMNSIIFEFINHQIQIYESDSLPINVLTNQSYSNCLTSLENVNLPPRENVYDYITTKRFVDAVEAMESLEVNNNEDGIEWLFQNLKNIEGSPESLWRLVFDQKEMKIYFLTKNNKQKRFVDLSSIDFSCSNNNNMLNIDSHTNYNATAEFKKYYNQENISLYKSTMRNLRKTISDKEIRKHIKFLEAFNCVK